jgi:hypothetical protein
MILEEAAQGWPTLKKLLNPLAPRIASLNLHPARNGHKAVLRFSNDYGVEIFKPTESDCFEMTVIRFHGQSLNEYKFVYDTPIPDLNLGYDHADILELCEQVSRLH